MIAVFTVVADHDILQLMIMLSENNWSCNMRYNILGKFCVVTQEKAWVVKNPINTWYDETRISTVQQRAMEVNFLKNQMDTIKANFTEDIRATIFVNYIESKRSSPDFANIE